MLIARVSELDWTFCKGGTWPFCFTHDYAHRGGSVAISPAEFLLTARTNGIQKTGTLVACSNIHFSPVSCGQDRLLFSSNDLYSGGSTYSVINLTNRELC